MAGPAVLNNLTPIGSGGTTTTKPGSPSIKHDLGQLFGHALNALPGYSTLGANITNPNINYLGVSNPGDPGVKQPATPAPQPTQQPQQQITQTDPYAGTVFGSTAGHDQAISDYNNLKNTTLGSVNNAITGGTQGFNSSILDYLDSRKTQQNNIDSERVQNELARQQGFRSITDMVGNGIKSGGVILANDNAGSSSAREALARAYSTIARQQASTVGNQAAQGGSKIDAEQAALAAADVTQGRHTQESKTNTINTIVSNATDALTRLNQQAAYASLPDRVQIDQEIARIKQEAMSSLSAFDNELSNGIAGQGPADSNTTRAKATTLLTAGVAPENSFNYTSNVPAELQGTGQFASSLPIFTAPTNRRNNQF